MCIFVHSMQQKAFDRINHFYLLSCLCDHGLPFDLIQVFHSWLRNMKSCVSWGNEMFSFLMFCLVFNKEVYEGQNFLI